MKKVLKKKIELPSLIRMNLFGLFLKNLMTAFCWDEYLKKGIINSARNKKNFEMNEIFLAHVETIPNVLEIPKPKYRLNRFKNENRLLVKKLIGIKKEPESLFLAALLDGQHKSATKIVVFKILQKCSF